MVFKPYAPMFQQCPSMTLRLSLLQLWLSRSAGSWWRCCRSASVGCSGEPHDHGYRTLSAGVCVCLCVCVREWDILAWQQTLTKFLTALTIELSRLQYVNARTHTRTHRFALFSRKMCLGGMGLQEWTPRLRQLTETAKVKRAQEADENSATGEKDPV